MENSREENSDKIIRDSLQIKFYRERERALNADIMNQPLVKQVIEPVQDDEYKAECSVLPANFLDGFILREYLDNNFMDYLCYGLKGCVAVLPFAENCSSRESLKAGGRWEQFLKNRKYLYIMRLSSDGLTQRNSIDMPGYYFDLLPEILRKDVEEGGCTFRLNYPFLPQHGVLPEEYLEKNREWLKSKINKALNNLRQFFSSTSDFG